MDYKLCVFDVDGTLVHPKSGGSFRKTADDWLWMPNRQEKYRELHEAGVELAIATNQGGPLWRIATGKTHFPSAQDVTSSLKQMMMELSHRRTNDQDPWLISIYDPRAVDLVSKEAVLALKQEMHEYLSGFNCWISIDPEWRKPHPGMLQAAMNHYTISAVDTLYVGDRDEDKQAAEAAGVTFVHADEFFNVDRS